jgi:hypothetical protein
VDLGDLRGLTPPAARGGTVRWPAVAGRFLLALGCACAGPEPEQRPDGHGGGAQGDSALQDGGEQPAPAACCLELVVASAEPVVLCGRPDGGQGSLLAVHAAVGHRRLTLRASGGEPERALHLEAYEALGVGTFPNPLLEYWDAAGVAHGNGGMNGSLTLAQWGSVAGEVRGSFEGEVRSSTPDGGDPLPLRGSFCAVREQ